VTLEFVVQERVEAPEFPIASLSHYKGEIEKEEGNTGVAQGPFSQAFFGRPKRGLISGVGVHFLAPASVVRHCFPLMASMRPSPSPL
jgi:hypothetical protein